MRLYFYIFLSLITLITPARGEGDNRITVMGRGVVSAIPDMALINLGVISTAPSANEAMMQNSAKMQGVLDALTSANIAPSDIQTTQINLHPQWERRQNNTQQPKITGYQAQNAVVVQLRNIANIGPLLDVLIKSGANSMNGISFAMQDTEKQMDMARRQAVSDAQRRANLYADAAGLKLGRVISVSEVARGPSGALRAMGRAASVESVPIQAGSLDFSAQITVVYAVLP
ncbi:SIMPL domain-containing protein [Amylibacter marinus]|uniref:SIMPL domain-containing protein n=1 Tax=Amylibacter marinus TaxID=1475483 RepID=A0ABQ5VT70_9RHOB|nr:SIMPL domain-containing protein [Amylibacter marinus]GLQ34625.1 SIMPL domain-containing protein [Amylibacter marinus]